MNYNDFYDIRESIAKIIDFFDLQDLKEMGDLAQDWESFASNINNLKDYITAYNLYFTEINDKVALMSLILETSNEFLSHIQFNETSDLLVFGKLWLQIKKILVQDQDIHAKKIKYWYCPNAETWEEIFYITPFLRGLNLKDDLEEWIFTE
ncbi:MAG: hypothetical protein IV090_00330 [Candidatus Sericytochromatia bacterium]|nr:hypothetical protein [Candidatus Sericytochromatia bacterium]